MRTETGQCGGRARGGQAGGERPTSPVHRAFSGFSAPLPLACCRAAVLAAHVLLLCDVHRHGSVDLWDESTPLPAEFFEPTIARLGGRARRPTLQLCRLWALLVATDVAVGTAN